MLCWSTGESWYRSPQARIQTLPNQIPFPLIPLSSFNCRCMSSNISLPTMDISSIISNVKFSNFDLSVFSFANERGGSPDRFVTFKSKAEWIVMPSTLNGTTPVGAVTSTVTSMGFILFESLSSFLMSDWTILITWLVPTPPGPLKNILYGFISWLFFQAFIAFVHHLRLYDFPLFFLFKPRMMFLYSVGVMMSLSASTLYRATSSLFCASDGPTIIASFACKSSAAIGLSN